MVKIAIIEKNGACVDKDCGKLKLEDLYKKCNFRKNVDFKKIHSFKVKQHYVHVFGKTDGRANQENKFDFPPPIDNELYFGNMALLKSQEKDITDDNIIDYDSASWNKDYETLMGGFEDIGSNDDDDYESDELETYPKEQLTKQGYLKDGFVVQDEDDNDEEEDDDEEDSYQDNGEKSSETECSYQPDESDDDSDSELSEEEYDTE